MSKRDFQAEMDALIETFKQMGRDAADREYTDAIEETGRLVAVEIDRNAFRQTVSDAILAILKENNPAKTDVLVMLAQEGLTNKMIEAFTERTQRLLRDTPGTEGHA